MCVIPHNAWELWGFIRSHLRCCARAVTIRVLCAGGHCHIQIDTQLSHIEYKVYLYRYYANTNNSCVLLHSACWIREETCSQSKFGHKTEFMSNEMQRLIKFDADAAYSTIISFVICFSSFCLRHTVFCKALTLLRVPHFIPLGWLNSMQIPLCIPSAPWAEPSGLRFHPSQAEGSICEGVKSAFPLLFFSASAE